MLVAWALWRASVVPPWAAVCVALSAGILFSAILEVGVIAIPFILISEVGGLFVVRALLDVRARPAAIVHGP